MPSEPNAIVSLLAMAKRLAVAALLAVALASPASAANDDPSYRVLHTWYRLVLELVRHTPTYSPPVASRSFAYTGVAAFEALAGGTADFRSLAGQLNGFQRPLQREPGQTYSEAVILNSAMSVAVRHFFSNTGPTGQRAMNAMDARLAEKASQGVAQDVLERSKAHGEAVARHVIDWSAGDGGAIVENMGFPYDYELKPGKANWVPTSAVRQQQMPLLPGWGNNRPFAMPQGNACPLPPPPAYSEEPGSQFHSEAMEVYETVKTITDEQKVIARFWSDDPMLSPTPPGHWISIAWQLLEEDGADAGKSAETMALLGIGLADSFIGCWNSKFEYDLLRPVTYIRRVIDPSWEPILITPPFPEYPSGHSTQSGAAAQILTGLFGENRTFTDRTHEEDGMPGRSFPNFWAAANEAGISRLYGGIHFRAAIDRGLDQGRCIGDFAAALKTRN
ncbi:MAG TPA: vanadium-dependent haloperoxidase [Rhizobiaceae bacterium]|nr:vanadium-dependent haloperoxidase [Rhizobiaceae bacterium]